MLTFDDLRLDLLKIAGTVRGTGTDFRWVGDLQAAAASTKSLTLGGLFLSDAVAEHKDRQIIASAGTGRAKDLRSVTRSLPTLLHGTCDSPATAAAA